MKLVYPAILALGLIAAPASAGTIFTDRATFLAATSAITSDLNLPRFSLDVLLSPAETIAFSGFSFTLNLNGRPQPLTPARIESLFGLGGPNPIDGSAFLHTGGLYDGSAIVIGLPQASRAFGFDWFGLGSPGIETAGGAEIFAGDVSLGFAPAIDYQTGSTGFLGYVAPEGTSFSTVSIVAAGRRRVGLFTFAGFDNFSVAPAAAVPEPAAWAMMILGIGAVGFAMRRSKQTTQVRFAIA